MSEPSTTSSTTTTFIVNSRIATITIIGATIIIASSKLDYDHYQAATSLISTFSSVFTKVRRHSCSNKITRQHLQKKIV